MMPHPANFLSVGPPVLGRPQVAPTGSGRMIELGGTPPTHPSRVSFGAATKGAYPKTSIVHSQLTMDSNFSP